MCSAPPFDLCPLPFALSVPYRYKRQARSRCGGAGRASIARLKHLVNRFRRPKSGANLRKSTGDGADHVPQKTVAFTFEDDFAL